ncbi:MAG TPA: hypothetical protein VG347_20535 [Verrucomicrobiae bacterium]|nr:hypothetical protein [Verrucomicrobiae bacterium]
MAGFKQFLLVTGTLAALILAARAQSLRTPWSGHAHDAQHSALSPTASQSLNRIEWRTSMDGLVQFRGNFLAIHYGSPLVTRSNTVIVPVNTGLTNGFLVEALSGASGATNWTWVTDYLLPPHNWIPGLSSALTPKGRLYLPGGGGTVYFCDKPDKTNGTPSFGQAAFYGLANYLANTNAYLTNAFINTPITSDRYGDIFFGFQVTGATPVTLQSGLARIDFNGTAIWVSATNITGDTSMSKVQLSCAPALNNDHTKVYVAINNDVVNAGYLVELDSRTLAVLAKVRLKDVKVPANDASIADKGTASPVVAPDGDVYFGVQENPFGENHTRGWLLHFDSALAQLKTPGAFGWDDTPSIVPSSLVPSYRGSSPYLLLVKYNNYVSHGGDGINQLAILDPQNSMTDPITGATVMTNVLTIAGPTPDPEYTNTAPNAVREWCVNTVAIDPASKSALVNNEDGRMYRWSFASNKFTETNVLNSGTGEAYTPTVIGVNGFVYAIQDAILYCVGQ